MKIGIISDSHDRLDKIEKSIDLFNHRRIDLVLHAGDFVSPFALKRFGRLDSRLIVVFGNNDGDRLVLRHVAEKLGFEIHISPYELSIDKKRLLIMHEPLFLAYLKNYDLIVYGHTHQLDIKNGHPMIINPGDSSGWLASSTAVILNLVSMETEIVNL